MSRKQVVLYKVCDRCPKETVAVTTDRFSLNGHKFEIDLCEKHSAELYAFLMGWGDSGVKKGEPTMLERQQVARTTVVPVGRPAAPPVKAEERRAAAQEREPLPESAESWRLTQHAVERRDERHLDMYEVLMTAERPESDLPADNDGRRPEVRVRVRGDVKVFVNTDTHEIESVARREEPDEPVAKTPAKKTAKKTPRKQLQEVSA